MLRHVHDPYRVSRGGRFHRDAAIVKNKNWIASFTQPELPFTHQKAVKRTSEYHTKPYHTVPVVYTP